MTLYDSSVLTGYLDSEGGTVDYVRTHLDERAVAPPLVMFDVYRGEVFKTGLQTSTPSTERSNGLR